MNDWHDCLQRLPTVNHGKTIRHYQCAYGSGHRDDYLFLVEAYSRFPDKLAVRAAEVYQQVYRSQGRIAANDCLVRMCEAATPIAISLAASDERLIARAKRLADSIRGLSARLFESAALTEAIKDQLQQLGIRIEPILNQFAPAQLLARAKDNLWWRRLLRTTIGRAYEIGAIMLGFVHRRAELYVSRRTLAQRQDQLARSRSILDSYVAVNELRQEYTLLELASKSISNPAIRRAEWMARCYGFEVYAEKHGHVALFLTITCPSRMHARLFASGGLNPRYDGTSPREAQKYLTHCWSLIRSALCRRKIHYYGMRIAEPHHDGTPHWHLLVFVELSQADGLTAACQEHALRVDGDEPGAESSRFKCERIVAAKGRPTAYIAKYISKNLDAYRIDQDECGLPGADSAKRVDAWRSRWGIRQFQQIGGPPVTIWRELRRLDPKQHCGVIEMACTAADAGNWADFVDLMGGANSKRKSHPIQLAKVWNDKPNRYGEPTGTQICGLRYGSVVIPTRIHSWRIEQRSTKPAANAESAPERTHGTCHLPRVRLDATSRKPEVHLEPALMSCIDPHQQNSNEFLSNPEPRGPLEHGKAGCGTRSGAGLAGQQPGRPSPPAPQPAGAPCQAGHGLFPPWSSVNNCTEGAVQLDSQAAIQKRFIRSVTAAQKPNITPAFENDNPALTPPARKGGVP